MRSARYLTRFCLSQCDIIGEHSHQKRSNDHLSSAQHSPLERTTDDQLLCLITPRCTRLSTPAGAKTEHQRRFQKSGLMAAGWVDPFASSPPPEAVGGLDDDTAVAGTERRSPRSPTPVGGSRPDGGTGTASPGRQS